MRTRKRGRSGRQAVIPTAIRRQPGIEPGTKLDFELEDDSIRVRPHRTIQRRKLFRLWLALVVAATRSPAQFLLDVPATASIRDIVSKAMEPPHLAGDAANHALSLAVLSMGLAAMNGEWRTLRCRSSGLALPGLRPPAPAHGGDD